MAKNIFSGWKKFSTNGKNTIMAHPSGHKMIIQHKHLKPEHLEQLHSLPFAGQEGGKPPKGTVAMADGGSVDNVPEPNKKSAQQMQDGATSGSTSASDAWSNLKSGLGFANGGPIPAPSPSSSPNLKENYKNQPLTDQIQDPDLRRTIEMEPRRQSKAEGGEVEPTPTQSPAPAPGDVSNPGEYDPSQDTQINHQKPPAKAKGQWRWFADGGDVTDDAAPDTAPEAPSAAAATPNPQSDISPELQKKREFYNHETSVPTGRGFVSAPDKQFGPNGEPPKNFDAAAANRADQDYAQAQQNDADDKQQAATATAAENQARVSQGLAPLPMPMAAAAAEQDPKLQGQVAQATAPQTPGDPYGSQAYSDAYVKGVNEQKAGLKQEAASAQQMGDAQAQTLANAQQAQQQNLQDYQTHYQNLDTERQNFVKDINNQHIDPNHYWNDKGTAGKISTAIGLLLGGIGGGLQKTGKNAAADFLQANIERDIDAQKANLGKTKSLLEANMQQFKNMRDATDMTRVMQTDIVSNQLKQEAAKASGPMAKAHLLQAAGQLDQQTAPVLSQIAMRKTLLSGMNAGRIAPEQVIRAIVPAPQQEPAYKELKEAKGMINLRDQALSAFDQIAAINTPGNRLANPIQSKAQVEKIVGGIVPTISKESAGRYTESDAEAIKNVLVSTPWDNAQSKAIGRQELNKLMSAKLNFPQLEAYGIDLRGSGRYDTVGRPKIKLGPVKQ